MSSFQVSVFIERNPDVVFDFATDLDYVSTWIPEITRIEKLTDGPLASGSQFRETRKMGGREHSSIIEVSEHERPRVHAASARCMGCVATYRYTFEPEGGGTRIDLHAEVVGSGLAKLIAPMLLAMMKKQDGGQLDRLKTAIESHVPAGA